MTQFELTRRACLLATAATVLTPPAAGAAGAAGAADDAALMKRGYADGPYGQIHYRIVRPRRPVKPPLVCLHPSPLSGIVYDRWLVEMGKDRIAVAPDTPGYGGSDTPPNPVEIADFAAAMIRFTDELSLHTVDVMGYHTGSLTSVELARRYPQRIRRVVMISAPNWTAEELATAKARFAAPPPSFEQMLERTLSDYRKQGKGLFRDMPDERYYDLSLERMRHYRTSNWGFRAAYNYDVLKALPDVMQPILILNPEDDVWEKTPLAKPYLRNGSIHDLPGWTHGHLDIHAVEMAAIVREFLDSA
jgi:pimeloyl-ACP methyl ester carboxylesterase